MTFQAQFRLLADEQGGRLSGCVGIVTVETALPGRFVGDSCLRHSLLYVPVALEAQLFPGGPQELPISAGVGIMAVSAAALGYHLVDAGGLGRKQIVVALKADLLRFCVQEVPMVGGMGIVAFGALPLGNGGMDVTQFQFFLKRLVAGQTEVSVRSGFQFVWVFSLCAQGQDQDPQEPQDGGSSYDHGISPYHRPWTSWHLSQAL